MMLAKGHVLNNRYCIVEQIGQGGFGSVYRAWDLNLNRACAIKENTDFTESTQRQFEREALVLSNLNHPNLVRVFDLINIPGQAQYLVMDYVDGEDLDSLLQREKRIDPARALGWIYKVCEALTYLHEQTPPIIHRDIKPANIRLTPKGEVVLVDFGLVKVYAGGRKTTMGARAVTPGFSPPEQYGHGTTDPRTDVYALAATLYNLLTGDPPEESVQRLFAPVLRSVQAVNPHVSPQLDLVLAKGLDVNAANRYQTIKAFQQALERATRPVVLSPAYPSANVGMNRSSASPAALSGSTKTSIRPRLNPFAITTKTIIATGLGAAIFTVLLMYVRIPSPVPNASFWPAYGLGAFFAVLFGPIAGTMIAFIGHAMADAIQYGTPWWSWVIASGVAGFIYGFGYMRIGVEEGTFMGKDRLTFNRIQVIGNAIAWIVVAPVLDIVIYKEPVNLVFTQGFIAAISNSVSVGFFGTLLLSLYASIRRQRISSIQTT